MKGQAGARHLAESEKWLAYQGQEYRPLIIFEEIAPEIWRASQKNLSDIRRLAFLLALAWHARVKL